MVGAGTEARGIIVEAAIKDRPAMHELSAQNICASVVQSHTLYYRSNKLTLISIKFINKY